MGTIVLASIRCKLCFTMTYNSTSSVDIKRTRCHSNASSAGSHRRRHFPEKLVDKSRRVAPLGLADVDNGASITTGLANVVSLKACQLEITLKNTTTGQLSPPSWGQAGLIQAERLTASPPDHPRKRQAQAGTDPERPSVEVASSLRSSRFEAIPITCIHNVQDDVDDGVTWEFERSVLTAVAANVRYEVNFENARYMPGTEESVVLRPSDANDEAITWDCHDVTTAPKIENAASPLTRKDLGFQKVVRDGFEFQVGQKIGMAVYRNFEVTPEDAGMSPNSVTADELRQIFGREGRVNTYTGQIMNVSPDKTAFEHNINAFRGCSGAVIFLLDVDQEGLGVIENDYGKAIAVHVGGDRLSGGTIVNFAFKIHA
jgi:hypothetical protein